MILSNLTTIGIIIISIIIGINLLVPLAERNISNNINKTYAKEVYERKEKMSFIIFLLGLGGFFYSLIAGTIFIIIGFYVSMRAEVYKDRSEDNHIFKCNRQWKKNKKSKTNKPLEEEQV